jgi:hypothetical protein
MYSSVSASAFPLAFAPDLSLQKSLNHLTQKNKKLAKLRIALVDLTDLPQGSPGRYASQNDMRSISIDSTAKIAAMYAAYQLRHDLREYARITKITDRNQLVKGFLRIVQMASNAVVRAVASKPPKFDSVLDLDTFSQSGGLDFTRSQSRDMKGMIQYSSDIDASYCIAYLGFEWINGLLRQSGLAALSSRGSPDGFFLGQLYASVKHEDDPYLKIYSHNWPREPRKSDHKAGTARAIAQFLTLLARGDLVDEASSQEMRDLMKDPKGLSFFGKSLVDAFGAAAYQRIATKVGYLPNEGRAGDCALIERTTDKGRQVRYVAVGLGAPWVKEESNPPLEELLRGLDTCILTRNGIET